jgi:uncharacterized membrane protein YgdD (TMEM256/DUF423 family)
MNRNWFAIGSISAMLSVALGAFGAHSLNLVGRYAEIYETGATYHMTHSLALLIVAIAWEKLGAGTIVQWAARLLCIGIVIFSGSLYVLSITEIGWLGAVTPIGGIGFLAGWAMLALAALRKK